MTTSRLRRALRDRLTTAMRERDRVTVSALRTTLAALDNAEAVPVAGRGPGGASTSGSQHVAGAAIGLGAAEADRRELDDDEERRIVAEEVASLHEAARHRRDAGDPAAADATEVAARLLEDLAASVG